MYNLLVLSPEKDKSVVSKKTLILIYFDKYLKIIRNISDIVSMIRRNI